MPGQRAVDVDDDVDSGGVEDADAGVVVEGRVDVVRADGVDLGVLLGELLEYLGRMAGRTPRSCMSTASRRQTVALLSGSKPEVP